MKENESKTLTIYDIAEEAGVSASTVSRVISGSAKVSDKTARKVRRIIEKYKFHPSELARGLAVSKSHMLGILASDIRNPYYGELVVAIEETALQNDYSVVLMNSLNDYEREKLLLRKLKEQGVDAIIQLGGIVDDTAPSVDFMELLNTEISPLPYVTTGQAKSTNGYLVNMRVAEAMAEVMEYLFEHGHRKIAMLGGSTGILSTGEKRSVYRRMLERNGCEVIEEWIPADGSYNQIMGKKQMDRILDSGKIPTAVVTVNDLTAVGVYESCANHGLKIPKDISVVSFDNTYLAETLNPKLSSVDYHYAELGRQLALSAMQAAEGEQPNDHKTVKIDLVKRESVARVRT